MMQNKKIKIALTGGYASGKSTVLKRFWEHGYLTYSADEIYNELLKQENFVKKICKILEVEPIYSGGKICINREKVAEVVFNDKSKLKLLNDFTHKVIYDKINELFEGSTQKIIFEIPLLFEENKQDDFDKIIVVIRDEQSRKAFGAKRDGISSEKASLRIKNQVDYAKISLSAYTVIYNNGDIVALYNEVDRVVEDIEREIS